MILNQLRYCALVTYSDLSDTLQICSRFLWKNFQCHLFLVYSACLCFRLPFFNMRFIRIEFTVKCTGSASNIHFGLIHSRRRFCKNLLQRQMIAVTFSNYQENSKQKHRLNYDDVTQLNSCQVFSRSELTLILDSLRNIKITTFTLLYAY